MAQETARRSRSAGRYTKEERAGDRLELELPGYNDGYRDGLIPGIEDAFTDTVAALAERERLDWTNSLREKQRVAEIDLRSVNGRMADLATAQAKAAPPKHPLWLCVLFALVAFLGALGETALLSEMAEFLGYVEPWQKWAFGAGFTLIVGVGLEVTHEAFGRVYRGGFIAALVGALSSLAALRVADLQMNALDSGNPWAELLVGQSWIAYWFLLSLSVLLALGVALVLDALRVSLPAHRMAVQLAAARWRRAHAERALALLEAQIAHITERIAAVAREKLAECHAGVVARRHHQAHPKQAPAPWWRRWTVGQLARFAVATATVLAATFFIVGCSGSDRGGHHILIVDTSRSSPISDQDASKAISIYLSRLPRGSRLDVLPVNGKAGDMLTFDVPRRGRPYDTDLDGLFGDADHRLREQLPAWRAVAGSDYSGVLRLAEERLTSTTSERKTLAILGDLVDDGPGTRRYLIRDSKTGKSVDMGIPRGVSTLPVLSLGSADLYVGLLPGSARASSASAQVHRERIEREIAGWGLAPGAITLNVFGMQGLEAWADAVIGPITKAHARFSQRVTRRQLATTAGKE